MSGIQRDRKPFFKKREKKMKMPHLATRNPNLIDVDQWLHAAETAQAFEDIAMLSRCLAEVERILTIDSRAKTADLARRYPGVRF
jgi:hypothetical protein